MKKQRNKLSIIYFTILITLIFGFSKAPMIAKAANNTLAAPSSVKAALTSYNSITVVWNSVKGASGYEVYQATSNKGTYSLLTTTKSKSYLHTNLNTGTTYYYKIKAFKTVGKSKSYSKDSTVAYAKPFLSIPSSIKANASSYNSITVSWGGVSGASCYRIYRATSIKGSYIFVADTTDKKFLDTELDTGTSYYYKVRAYIMVGNGKVYGKYSTVVNTKTTLSKPTALKVVNTTSDSISIEWSGAEGASGYELYASSSSKNSFTLLARVTETNYINTGLSPKTSYYYKIRAYRSVKDSNIYSKFTSITSGATQQLQPTTIVLNDSDITLSLGQTNTLVASVFPEDAVVPNLTWNSSDENIAIVDNVGNITPISAGTAIVSVVSDDGKLSASCTVTVKLTKIKGIDVSYHQGGIDWASVKNDGVEFVMMRSSYGSSTVDKCFEVNYENAKANDIAVGAYHYSYATSVSKAKTEVKFLISTLKGKQFEYPVCVDMEDAKSMGNLSTKTRTDIALVYINELKNAGYYPIIYANKYWFTSMLDDKRLVGIDHWLAQYNTKYTYTGAVSIWQYSSSGKVDGISGRVDMDISYVDLEAKIKHLKLNGFE